MATGKKPDGNFGEKKKGRNIKILETSLRLLRDSGGGSYQWQASKLNRGNMKYATHIRWSDRYKSIKSDNPINTGVDKTDEAANAMILIQAS